MGGRLAVIFLCVMSLDAEELGVLPEVLRPQLLRWGSDQLVVVEEAQFFIYSFPSLTLVATVGQRGQGPGEFDLDPSRNLLVHAVRDGWQAESRKKIVYFSREGHFLREQKKSPHTLQTLPFGEGFALLHIEYGDEGKAHFVLSLADAQGQPFKELLRQPFFTFQEKLYVLPDRLNAVVWHDELWVEDSFRGGGLLGFNGSGEEIGRCSLSLPSWDVLQEEKDQAFEKLCQIPSIQRVVDERGRGALTELLKETHLVYPEVHPQLDYLTTDGVTLIGKRPQRLGQEGAFVWLTPRGEIIKERRLPAPEEMPFLTRLQGDRECFAFTPEYYLWLQPKVTEGEEVWTVQRESCL
jgi:hypothetical protein